MVSVPVCGSRFAFRIALWILGVLIQAPGSGGVRLFWRGHTAGSERRQDPAIREPRAHFRENEELFNDTSWFAVMIGQGLRPRRYDPMADVMSLDELRARFANMKSVFAKSVEVMPTRREFIARNCAATPVQELR